MAVNKGRPGKYEYWLTQDGIVKISGWARDGLTDEQMAQNMGIAYSTFKVWKLKFPAITAALKNEKDIADRHVENALYKRATGYGFIEKKTTINEIYNPVTGRIEKLTKTEVMEKHMAPDPTAIIYWLKNRKPGQWNERKQEPEDLHGELSKVDALIAGLDKLAKGGD